MSQPDNLSSPENRTVYIYGLVDPRDGRIRYVGQSIHPFVRLRGHLNGDVQNSHPKALWLKSLKSVGAEPHLVILDEVEADKANAAEQEWIGRVAITETDLTNIQLVDQYSVLAESLPDGDLKRLLSFLAEGSVTTEDLAEITHLSIPYINLMLNGRRAITGTLKWRLFCHFGESLLSVFSIPERKEAA